MFALAALVGLAGGLAACALEWALEYGSELLIGRFTHLGEPNILEFHWGVLLFPALGGLLSGIVVHLLCPQAVGHGTDVLIRAFHRNMGDLPLRGPTVKAAAAVGVISCGGSAGPEGPIAALGAAIGSTIGSWFGLQARERRALLVAGCGAGVGAMFKCPLGGALFATSVLYSDEEFEAEAIVPAFVASVLGYTIYQSMRHGLGGVEYMLAGATGLGYRYILELLPYTLLGPLCGLASIFYVCCIRFVERRTARAPLPRWLMPAAGGLGVGALACLLPQVMDGRYLFIQKAIDIFGQAVDHPWRWVAIFGAVTAAKCVATALTVGSGASGGALGPSLFVGGTTGAFFGALILAVWPSTLPPDCELIQALIPVGMGGVLAATMRTPLAAIVMITEMTGSYGLIVPLMLVCMSAYVVGRRWGLNVEQVRGVSESPVHAGDAVLRMLETWRVEDVMERNWSQTVRPDTSLSELVRQLHPGTRPVFAVTENGPLLGLISLTDIRRIMRVMTDPAAARAVIALDIMTENLTTVDPGVDVYQALDILRRSRHDVLPVVSRRDAGRWLGMLSRDRIFESVQRHIADLQQHVFREHGGLAVIGQEGQLQQLVMGVTPMRKDMIQRLMVPLDAVGKSLRQSDFRRQYGGQVVAIEQPDGTIQCPPDLDAPLEPGNRLLVIM